MLSKKNGVALSDNPISPTVPMESVRSYSANGEGPLRPARSTGLIEASPRTEQPLRAGWFQINWTCRSISANGVVLTDRDASRTLDLPKHLRERSDTICAVDRRNYRAEHALRPRDWERWPAHVVSHRTPGARNRAACIQLTITTSFLGSDRLKRADHRVAMTPRHAESLGRHRPPR